MNYGTSVTLLSNEERGWEFGRVAGFFYEGLAEIRFLAF